MYVWIIFIHQYININRYIRIFIYLRSAHKYSSHSAEMVILEIEYAKKNTPIRLRFT